MAKNARIVRSPPPLPFQKAENGICRACGVEILTAKGERHKGRRWCDEHQKERMVLQHPHYAKAAVFRRDMGICCDCGADCTSYETSITFEDGKGYPYRVQINCERALEWCNAVLERKQNPRSPQSAYLIDLGLWECDHAMPLHLVDRADPEAWKQWTLENLRTRCPACHQEKTTKEAKVRAKIRRINGENKPKPKTNWPSRKIQSRDFSKGKRAVRS